MVINVKKFGTILNGRPAGRESALILTQMLRDLKEDEEIVFDFSGVKILTPSYADEFLQPIKDTKGFSVQIVNTSPLIRDTLTAIDIANTSKVF